MLNIFKMGKGKKNTGTSQAFVAGACAFAKVWIFFFLIQIKLTYSGERLPSMAS